MSHVLFLAARDGNMKWLKNALDDGADVHVHNDYLFRHTHIPKDVMPLLEKWRDEHPTDADRAAEQERQEKRMESVKKIRRKLRGIERDEEKLGRTPWGGR